MDYLTADEKQKLKRRWQSRFALKLGMPAAFFVVFSLTACDNSSDLTKPVKFSSGNSPEFYRVLEKTSVFKEARLPAGTECARFRHGIPQEAILHSNWTIRGLPYAAGTRLGFSEDGKVVSTAPYVTPEEKTTFKSFKPPQTISTVKCSSASVNALGKLISGKLAGDQLIQGVNFKDQTTINLYPNGAVRSGTLSFDQSVNGVNMKGGTVVDFYESGHPSHGFIANNEVLSSYVLRAGTPVSFYDQGGVQTATLGAIQTIKGFPCTGTIVLYDNGQVARVTPTQGPVFNHNAGRTGNDLMFDEQGKQLSRGD